MRMWSQKARIPAEGLGFSSPTSNHTVSDTPLVVTAKLSSMHPPSFPVSSLLLSPLMARLISSSLIRRRHQCANKISSFNVSPKCEYFKENEGLVTLWLFLLPATHLPFGQSVPIRACSSFPPTHCFLLSFLVLCKIDSTVFPFVKCSSSAFHLAAWWKLNKPFAVGTTNTVGAIWTKYLKLKLNELRRNGVMFRYKAGVTVGCVAKTAAQVASSFWIECQDLPQLELSHYEIARAP